MALIAMCVYDTEENQRSEYTNKTLQSLAERVDFRKHRLIVVDNNSIQKTREILKYWQNIFEFEVITLPENVGTAKGINYAWRKRAKGENAIKMDNDIVVHYDNWVDELEEVVKREPKIGIVGLKRKDCWENPKHESPFYRSRLMLLPPMGDKWLVFEEVNHVMGTCQLYSSTLLDRIGYLNQPTIYGFDDALASFRAKIAGYAVGFLPHIEIDHIDINENPYWREKQEIAQRDIKEYNDLIDKYRNGELDVYYEDKI